MVKNLFETLQAVVERSGVCVVYLSSVVCLVSSKLATRFRVKLLAIFTLLYKSLVYTTMSDCETNLLSTEESFPGTLF
jgi:hypothetical protein